jgi:threonine aldolase
MRIVDLRSDTVTKPTAAMRQAISAAQVGDDVFGEDPTVNHLEEMAAERLGKPAALFVASGTMANIVSQLTHCNRGDEAILGDQSHIFFTSRVGPPLWAAFTPGPCPIRSTANCPLMTLKPLCGRIIFISPEHA